MKKTLFSIALLMVISWGCGKKPQPSVEIKAGKTDSLAMDLTGSKPSPASMMPLAPGTCRVIGVVAGVEQELDDANPNSPCGKAPCRAAIKIESILGRGRDFNALFESGDTLAVHFAYTTAPTQSLFPDMDAHYPGVATGDTIQVDLKMGGESMTGANKTQPPLTIYGYTVR